MMARSGVGLIEDGAAPEPSAIPAGAATRAALSLAGKEIVRLNFGKENTPLLKLLSGLFATRSTLRERNE
jgi:hypothetical protein